MDIMNEIIKALKESQNVLIATHENPDGDCLGSAFALAEALKILGLKGLVVNNDPMPKNFFYMTGSRELILPVLLHNDFETAILVDCTDLGRLGFNLQEKCPSLKTIINIDHHVSNEYFGQLNYVDSRAAATGEIIYKLIKKMSVTITSSIATALYTAIVTDTGSFQFENTTPETLKIAGELMAAGADLKSIRKNIWDNRSLITLKLLHKALDSLQIEANGKLAWFSIDALTLENFKASAEHLEGLTGYPRSIEGVEVGIVFKEVNPAIIKISFRSKEYVNVNLLAQKFGGGGHPRAAGCTINGSLKEVIEMVTLEAEKMILEGKVAELK
ncbi:bifunctional oligoribonuclease/PAP phosphatase NrnA [Bacillota bacterium LX-D]|nr:bifunctional oligoribonuclease/PAP phosphatase NrnA [Bacillota bacterium LX-D]